MKTAAIVGVGESNQHGAVVDGYSPMGLLAEASLNALSDAGLTVHDVDGVLTGEGSGVFNHSVAFAEYLGIRSRFSTTIGLGGASAVASLLHAVRAIEAGLCSTVLIANGSMRSPQAPQDRSTAVARMAGLGHPQYEIPYGPLLISQYAMAAQRHMHEFGTTAEQLAEVAVTTREHARRTPGAQMTAPITIEDVLHSRWISEPLHLLDCCIISQGAGAFVVTRADKARDCRTTPVSILGGGEGHRNEYLTSMTDLTSTGMQEAGATAFARAGVTPVEVDFAEIYDCFTITVLMDLEDLGFCKKGEGGSFVENGRLTLRGELPVNTHGGLLSYCHIGGINHIVEAARQLRGDCGDRQVRDATIGVVTGNGGFLSTKTVAVLGQGG